MTSPANPEEKSVKTAKQSIPRRSESGPCPLSFAQERLWFLNQLEPESPAYNQPKAILLKGALEMEMLKKVLDAIVERHAVFRTSFHLMDGQPAQVIADKVSIELPMIDLSEIPGDQRQRELEGHMVEIAQRPFDLSRDPTLRAALLKLNHAEHVLLLVTHHIATDGWSSRMLFQEIATLYEAFSNNLSSPLPELPIQYADFAVWQRNWLQGEVLQSQLAYWKQQLAGELPILRLPTDYPRPAIQTDRGAAQTFALSEDLVQSLKSLSRRNRVTLFMTLLAAFQTLLYRYTWQDDIVIGAPIANRTRVEVERLIGFFANTLVLRTDLSGNPSFQELLSRVREVALGAYAHQDLPFEKLVEEINPERDLSRNPLFQVIFNLQNPARQEIQLSRLCLSLLPAHNESAKFDLSLSILDREEGPTATVTYNTDLFNSATISRMCGHFQTLLQGIVTNPEQRLSDLPILTEAERRQLLVEWNNTTQDYAKDRYIHELFEAQVERSPEAVAAVFEDKQLTYRELNRRANRLAHCLQKLGVGPDALVGICVERSLDMIVGLLAILKAGGAYVPLDPAYPKERLAFMLEDSRAKVLLTQQQLVKELFEDGRSKPVLSEVEGLDPQLKVVCLDTEWEVVAQESEANPVSHALPENLAYVIYTSGSTGSPKGVVVEHASLSNYVSWFNQSPPAKDLLCLPAVTRPTFDMSLKQLFSPLLSGKSVWIVSDDVVSQPAALIEMMSAQTAVGFNAVPSLWKALLDALDSDQQTQLKKNLSSLFLGGEQLTRQLLDRTFAALPHIEIWNFYGPTETTANATVCRVAAEGDISIGRPIANTKIYILDSHLQPVPVGVPGELHVGGDGLARGYLNRPELTAEKFIPNPFSDASGARLYKTGDLARYLPDGNIEFLGRIDHQVKIRGFRIELGEIETVLGKIPGIREAVVIVHEDEADKRLVTYVVASQDPIPTSGELRSFLKSKLPDYMIPSTFVFLDALPLTSNGKLDRRALPAPDHHSSELKETFVAPRTPTEKTIAEIWAQTLRQELVGIHYNFFDLGGHSLLATRVISRVRQAFGIELPLRALFENPTVAGLAAQVEQLKVNRTAPNEIADVLADVESLSDEEAEHLLAQGNFKTSN
jgi:amino acid adenylation domain-containing protein